MDVLTAAQNVAEDYQGGARQLAVDIDRNPVTLSHELTGTGTAKLGLRTAVKMTRRSKDLRILNAFAAECGCMVLMLPETLAVEGDAAMQLMGATVKEFNDVTQVFVAGAADGVWTGNECADLEKQGGELIAVVQRLMSHARAVYESQKPSHIRAVG